MGGEKGRKGKDREGKERKERKEGKAGKARKINVAENVKKMESLYMASENVAWCSCGRSS